MSNGVDKEKLRETISRNVSNRWNNLERLTEVASAHLSSDPRLIRLLHRANLYDPVQKALKENDVVTALTHIGSVLDRTIPKNSRKVIRSANRTNVARSQEKEEDRVMETSEPSIAQGAGQSAHDQVEKILTHPNDLHKVLAQTVTLVGNGSIEEVVFNLPTVPNTKPSSKPLFILEPTKKDPKPASQTITNQQKIHLIEPLPKPLPGQTLVDWGADLIATTTKKFLATGIKIPETPDEVVDTLNHHEAGKLLTQLLEIGHILYDNPDRLNLAESDSTTGLHQITDRDGVRSLNWLAINRLTLEAIQGKLAGMGWVLDQENTPKIDQSEQSAFREMTISRTRFLVPVEKEGDSEKVLIFSGGRIDNLSLYLPNQPGQLPLKTFSDHLESGLFKSQEMRYHRIRWVDGKPETYQASLNRLTGSLFGELFRLYGDTVFSNLYIRSEDIKMTSGDADRDTVIDVSDPLNNKHLRQVNDYVFFIASQLTAIEKRTTTAPQLFSTDGYDEGDLPAVTADEVADFINRYGLFRRFDAKLRYELPTETKLYPIDLPKSETEIRNWCREIVARCVRAAEQYEIQRLAAVAERRVTSQVEVQKQARQRPEIPNEFTAFCGETIEGAPRLLLNDFQTYLTNPENKISIDTAISYQEEGVFALWVRGLLPKNETVRVAIDAKHNRFIISKISGKRLLAGGLSSERSKAKVKENPRSIATIVADLRDGLQIPASSYFRPQSSVDRDCLVDAEGNIGAVSPSFPLLFTHDPLTNRWKFNYSELETGLKRVKETGLDPHGLMDWAIVVNRWLAGERYFRKSLRCAFWTHKSPSGGANTDTPAAAMMGTHGHCFSCGENFYLPLLPGEKLPIPDVAGDKLYHYRGVSMERETAFRRGQILAELFAKYDPTARNYIATRGIDPDNIGPFGYNPPELYVALSHFFPRRPLKGDTSPEAQEQQKAYQEFMSWIRINKVSDLPLDELVKIPDCPQDIKSHAQDIISALKFLPDIPNGEEDSPKRQALDTLTTKNIQLLKNRGIFREKFAGRLQLPTYWFPIYFKDGDKPELSIANYNSRLMNTATNNPADETVIEEADIDDRTENPIDKRENLTEAEAIKKATPRKYLKVNRGRLSKPIQVQEGDETITVQQLTTPPGVWVPDVDNFLADSHEEVVVFEGILNAAAYYTVFPEVKDRVLAICGTGHNAVIPFLKALNAKRVVVALDLDAPGRKAAERLMKLLDTSFGEEIEIVHISEILPEEFRPGRIDDTTKEDMNDLLLSTELGKSRRFTLSPQ